MSLDHAGNGSKEERRSQLREERQAVREGSEFQRHRANETHQVTHDSVDVIEHTRPADRRTKRVSNVPE